MSASLGNSTPLATAKTFLAGIKVRDKDSMRAICHPDATACLIRDGKPMHMLVANILDLMSEDQSVEMDEVSYDEVEHIDGGFATVWTPYQLFEDGKLHHIGTNNFCLWNSPDKGWLITAVQDVARPVEGVTNLQIVGGHDVTSALDGVGKRAS